MAPRPVSRHSASIWLGHTRNRCCLSGRPEYMWYLLSLTLYQTHFLHSQQGPAIDMLVSATLADGDPPICELPYVRTDASGQQQASETVPLTAKNGPEGLKKLLVTWTGIVQQLRQLDPQFHTEIARNICDLDPLMNVLSPQVMFLIRPILSRLDRSFSKGSTHCCRPQEDGRRD
jgi:hypothetical protein